MSTFTTWPVLVVARNALSSVVAGPSAAELVEKGHHRFERSLGDWAQDATEVKVPVPPQQLTTAGVFAPAQWTPP